jgi:hypothetical protein
MFLNETIEIMQLKTLADCCKDLQNRPPIPLFILAPFLDKNDAIILKHIS